MDGMSEYDKIKDLIEAHTSSLEKRMDRMEKRMGDQLDGVENTLLNLSTHGCMKGAEQDKRIEVLEKAPARVGAVILGVVTVVSSIVGAVTAVAVALHGE